MWQQLSIPAMIISEDLRYVMKLQGINTTGFVFLSITCLAFAEVNIRMLILEIAW